MARWHAAYTGNLSKRVRGNGLRSFTDLKIGDCISNIVHKVGHNL